uniref:Methylosome subunit pICln (inferred by orthology to a human protein) n=1 Tax=Strongyloides venezuelensis TaxID=75913 RepID=A0A0K0FY85_STRVS
MITLQEVLPPQEGVRFTEENVQLFYEVERISNGILYIGERNITWIEDGRGKGIVIPYQALVTHGISNDISAFPDRCLFLTIDVSKINFVDQSSTEGMDDNDECECIYLRMVPANDSLNIIFQIMTECQEMNPDEEDMEEEYNSGFQRLNGEGNGWCDGTNSESFSEMSELGMDNYNRLFGDKKNDSMDS